MVLIIWLAFFLLWAVLVRYGMRARVAFLAAQVVNGVLIVFATEVLSVFRALTAGPLVAFWSAVVLVNLALLWRDRGIAPWIKGFSDRRATARFFASWSALELGILAAVGLIVAVTAVIALVAPPNNYDSMIYHMSRVAHWAYNGTVANYPTNTLLQLVIPPYNAYAILQTYILSGSDYFANLVQWNSMVASLVGVSLMVELLGGSRRAQLLAVFFAATLPTGIVQASSTQNDYVATLWAVEVVVFALLLVTTGRWRWGILCALSFDLATFTKGVAMIVAGPFLIWAVGGVKWPVRYKFVLVLFIVGTILAVNAAFLHRLMELDPDPFRAMRLGGSAMVDTVDIRGAVSNAVRGMATELALPVGAWNRALFQLVEMAHRGLLLGIDDPRFSVAGTQFALWNAGPVPEDYVNNWCHSIIYLMLMIYIGFCAAREVLARRVRSDSWRLFGVGKERNSCGCGQPELFWCFMLSFVAAGLLFCAVVKWQEWIARFHVSFFVVFSAVAGLILSRIFKPPRRLLPALGLMFVIALWSLSFNPQRSLFPSGAVQRSQWERMNPRGGEIFDWLQEHGYFQARRSGGGYLTDITPPMRDSFKQAYPEDYEQFWNILIHAFSFSEGVLATPREELLFARFSKISRDQISREAGFMRHQFRGFPSCQDVGLVVGATKYEYPFWRLLDSHGRAVRVEHILVDNVSGQMPYPGGGLELCLILKEGNDGAENMEYNGRRYWRGTPGPWQVYVYEGMK